MHTSTRTPAARRASNDATWLLAALRRAQVRLNRLGDTVGSAEVDAALAGTEYATPAAGRPLAHTTITRSPGKCLSCQHEPGTGHAADCYFAPFLPGRQA